ncbi:MAG: cupin domain-containing protein [Nitrosomonadales bacterium]|nr:cupin domain-containing protein [Nitrosomonadales bacterium]
MNKRNPWSFPMLAASLALYLPHLALAQESAAAPIARNMSEMKFGELPGLPTCAQGSVQSGDPGKGPSIILAKLTRGCTIPWHWHTATENVMLAGGAGRLEMKDGKPHTLKAGGFAMLPSHHIHQFHCENNCALFIYSDAAFDIHYVNAKGSEFPPGEALQAVKEKAASAMK